MANEEDNIPIVPSPPQFTLGYDPSLGQVAFPTPQAAAPMAIPQQRSGGGRRAMGLTGTFSPIASITVRGGLVKKIVEGDGPCCPPSMFGQFDLSEPAGDGTVNIATIRGVDIDAGAQVLIFRTDALFPGQVIAISNLVVTPDTPPPSTPNPTGGAGALAFDVDFTDPNSDGGLFYFALQNPCGCMTLLGRINFSDE